MIGTKKGRIRMPDGSYKVIAFYGCKYVSDLAPFNLFSLTRALNGGCSLGNNGAIYTFTKNDFTLSFDQKIQTKTEYAAAVEIFLLEDNEVTAQALASNTTINVNEFYGWFGHVSEEKAKVLWDQTSGQI